MNWKNILTVSAKNAINAVLVSLTPMFAAPEQFNWHNWNGIQHMLEVLAGAVLAREAMVWGPKLLAWSQSPTPEAEVATK